MMSDLIESHATGDWTAADLFQRFGPIPLARVRHDPAPGTATADDVVRIHDSEDRLYELVDQTLIEKAVGIYESYLAAVLARWIGNFVAAHDLGIVLGADGMLRLAPGLVRIPDVSYIAWDRLPNRAIPDQAIAEVVPDLAVEVISRGNTPQEMERKRREHFDAGVRCVWYIFPREREARVYRGAEEVETISGEQTLAGGDVLPGFSCALNELFRRSPNAS